MNKRQKLAKSIKLQFGCSESEALAFSDDLIKAEGEPNGRIGNFQEFAESTAGHGEIGNDLSSLVKARTKARAGLKSFRNRDEIDEIKSRIAYIGGVRS